MNNIVVIANIEEKQRDDLNRKAQKSNIDDLKKQAKDCFEDYFNQSKTKPSLNKNIIKNSEGKKQKIITNKLKNTQLYEEEKIDKMVNSITENDVNYKKNIISCLDKICVSQYNIGQNFLFDPKFLDILCINCYECVKYNDVDLHSDFCVSRPFNDLIYKANEEDVNAKIYKLYQNMKKRENEIKATNNTDILRAFTDLIGYINEIFINNNVIFILKRKSIAELNNSIIKLNKLINESLNNISSNLKFTLFITAKRVSQLVYIKLQEIEKITFKRENEKIYSDDEFESENDDDFNILKSELLDLERETMKSKLVNFYLCKELNSWRKEAKKLERMLTKPMNNEEALSDINSEVLSNKNDEESEVKIY